MARSLALCMWTRRTVLAATAVIAAICIAYEVNLFDNLHNTLKFRRSVPNACKQGNSIAITLSGRATDEAMQNHVNQLANSNSKITFHLPALLNTKPENASWYQTIARINHTIGLYWDEFDTNKRSLDDFENSLKDCSEWMKKAVGEYPLFLRINPQVDSDAARERAAQLGFVQSQPTPDMSVSDCQDPPNAYAVNPTLSQFLAGYTSQQSRVSFITHHPVSCFRYPSYAGVLNSRDGAQGFNVVSLATCLEATGGDGRGYMTGPPSRSGSGSGSQNSKVNSNSNNNSNSQKGAARKSRDPATCVMLAVVGAHLLTIMI